MYVSHLRYVHDGDGEARDEVVEEVVANIVLRQPV